MNSIFWQPVPALPLVYVLQSEALGALEAASALFAPWLVPASEAPARCWSLRDEGQQWVLTDGEGSENRGALIMMLAHIEYGVVSHVVAHLPPPFIGLHGALLSRTREGRTRGVLVVGPKEAGKSTLACALWRAGWELRCDDFSFLDEQSRAYATARRVSLRAGSRALLGDLWDKAAQTPSARALGTGLTFHPHELPGAAPVASAPVQLDALIILNRRGANVGPGQSAPLHGIEAAFALLPYSTLLLDQDGTQITHERTDWGVGLADLASRIAAIPLYDLGRDEPQAMVAQIERLVKSAESVARQL